MRTNLRITAPIAGLLLLFALIGTVEAGVPLKPPFDIAARRALVGKPADGFNCKSAPQPVRDLTFGGFYRKGSGSTVVDHEAMRAYRAARRPLDRFDNAVISMGNRYAATRPADPAIARCVLAWLHRWAKGRAYLGEVSQQGGYVRKWDLGTISLAYLEIRSASGLDAGQLRGVRKWIRDWARVVRDDYSTHLQNHSRNNNHAYWAAWSVGLAAVVLDDRDMFGWMVDHYHAAMEQIGKDGTLPLELARKSKALHYHVFAAQALVMIAELGAANGQDLYGADGGALHRLIRRTVAGLSDPAYFERLTGSKQVWVGHLSGSMLAWMEPYYARFRTPALEPWIRRFRPMKNRRVGGDATMLYGTTLPVTAARP